MIRSVVIALVLVSNLAAAAEDPPLMCFGNEPSWGLALETPDTARLMLPDAPPEQYDGADTRIEFLRERVWRGKLRGGAGGELVAFLRDAECSDGMSNVKHPVVARVSLPDGRFLAGCCRITSGPGAAMLEGLVWRLVELRGQDAAKLAGLPSAVTVRFEGGRLQGFGGCNQLMGSYSIDRERVTIGQLAGTMMACPPPEMEIDSALRDALAGALLFRVVEGRLTLTSESGAEPRLVFEAAPPPRLEGIVWEVTGFNNGRHAVVGPLTGTTLSVTFQADGTVVGHSGCNSFRASYSREGDRLTIGAAAATRKICAEKGVMEQEREFLAALESTTTWALDREMLDLHRADGERVLFAREAAK